MDLTTPCPDCFQAPAPAPKCSNCGFDPSQAYSDAGLLPPFTKLAGGRFLSGRVLGQPGGFGVVYAGWQVWPKDGQQVAIKEFFPRHVVTRRRDNGTTVTPAPGQEQHVAHWRERFLDEAKLLRDFSDDHIVRVIDQFEDNGTVYLVMERLQGQTLAEYLGGVTQTQNGLRFSHPLSPADAMPLLVAAIQAMEVLHGRKPKPVIHRDITPNNIFLRGRRPEGLTLLDFGLAREGERPPGVASTSAGAGNPAFAAPEQLDLQGRLPITPATDCYGLGASLYAALTGVSPPPGDARRDGAPLAPLNEKVPELAPEVAKVIKECLELDPELRPRNATVLRRRLEAYGPPKAHSPTPMRTGETLDGAGEPRREAEKSPTLNGSPGPTGSHDDEAGKPENDEQKPWKRLIVVGAASLALLGFWIAWMLGLFSVRDNDQAITGPVISTPSPVPLPSVVPDPELVPIKGGHFLMGSPDSEAGRFPEERQHGVRVQDFRIGTKEVTLGEFRRFVEASGYQTEAELTTGNPRGCWTESTTDGGEGGYQAERNWRSPGFPQGEDHPVVCVSWHDAQAYIDWLNRRTGKSYRLPTEAEWEYAARAGTKTARYWGEDPEKSCRSANGDSQQGKRNAGCTDNFAFTAPAGSFAPSPFGLYDMFGNVWEWTCSAYMAGYDGSEARCLGKDQAGPLAVRGGAWFNAPAWLRSAFRGKYKPHYRSNAGGFRLAQGEAD